LKIKTQKWFFLYIVLREYFVCYIVTAYVMWHILNELSLFTWQTSYYFKCHWKANKSDDFISHHTEINLKSFQSFFVSPKFLLATSTYPRWFPAFIFNQFDGQYFMSTQCNSLLEGKCRKIITKKILFSVWKKSFIFYLWTKISVQSRLVRLTGGQI